MSTAIIVKCERGLGDKEGPSISDALITSEPVAVNRGKHWLDDDGGYYTVKKRTVKVPHKSARVLPRTWVSLTDSHLGLKNTVAKVKSYTINITRSSIWATMETEGYHAP
jgi:hypothetical protein